MFYLAAYYFVFAYIVTTVLQWQKSGPFLNLGIPAMDALGSSPYLKNAVLNTFNSLFLKKSN